MVFRATRSGSTPCRPSALRVTARTILLTSTVSWPPLRLVTCIVAGLCGGVSANEFSAPLVGSGVSARATVRSRTAVSRGCMASGSGWTSNACSRAQGLIATNTGGDAQADAMRRPAPRRTSPRKPSLRTGTRSSRCAGRSSDLRTWIWRSAYSLPLPSRRGPVHVGAFVSALPLRGSSGITPDSLLSPTDDRVWTGTDGHNISGGPGRVNPTSCALAVMQAACGECRRGLRRDYSAS